MTKIIKSILFFIPISNPDFDELIADVNEWQLEIDPNDSLPIREIGTNIKDKIIMIMPWRSNYGYWTDNNIELNQFKKDFNAIEISKEEFEKNWNSFAKNN